MKIIQSFAQFDEGSPYVGNNSSVYVNFYSFLLSFLTIRKYYGSVTMHCNELAYGTFIKFIPYDEVIIRENSNDFKYWNFYKLDSIKETGGDVIHVDTDVFIFNPLFDLFKNGFCDAIVQDKLTIEKNKYFVGEFVNDNYKRLQEFNIFDSSRYDGKCYSCGVLGMTEKVKSKYFEMVNALRLNIEGQALVSRYEYVNAVCEELGFYLTSLKHKLNVHEILPYNHVLSFGQAKTANMMKYTHLWFHSKFKKENVEKIKNKIKKEFSDQYYLIENYENYLKTNEIELKYL